MQLTDLEKTILDKLNRGLLNGTVGDVWEKGKVTVIKVIENGVPKIVRHGADIKFFDGKENIRTPGKKTVEVFKTIPEILAFFQKYGWLIPDPDVNKYSALYKPKKKK